MVELSYLVLRRIYRRIEQSYSESTGNKESSTYLSAKLLTPSIKSFRINLIFINSGTRRPRVLRELKAAEVSWQAEKTIDAPHEKIDKKTLETPVCSSKSYIRPLFARFGTQKTTFRSWCRCLGKVSALQCSENSKSHVADSSDSVLSVLSSFRSSYNLDN